MAREREREEARLQDDKRFARLSVEKLNADMWDPDSGLDPDVKAAYTRSQTRSSALEAWRERDWERESWRKSRQIGVRTPPIAFPREPRALSSASYSLSLDK
jgi:hypothetical protein